MGKPEVLLDGLTFPEAPRWRDGRLWFSDFYSHRVMTVDLAGRYLMPEFGEFFFYLAVIAIICIFPRGFAGRAK